jgi:ribosomal protein S18 acetylase RimI-like enzyme
MTDIDLIEIASSGEVFVGDAMDLLDNTQGKAIFSADYLIEIIEDAASLMLGAMRGTQLVGASWARKLTEFEYYAPFGVEATASLCGKTVGSLESSSVLASFQRQGIGRAMLAERMAWLVRNGCELAVAVSWVSGQRNSSKSLFEGAGFNARAQAADFYLADSQEYGFLCPSCDADGCRCSAILFTRSLG